MIFPDIGMTAAADTAAVIIYAVSAFTGKIAFNKPRA